MAPSKPCRRPLASAAAEGSKLARPKNSSEEMPFWVPNFWRAYFSESSVSGGKRGWLALVVGFKDGTRG